MTNVFITVDTEIWCDGWENLDSKFPGSFRNYVYGPTPDGDYALPATLAILEEFGLPAVFFVEPLFSFRFGLEPLSELVGVIGAAGQEIQLHLHTEWVDEAKEELLSGITEKIPVLTNCTLEQQERLIHLGLKRLEQAGVSSINAFRAGSYAANANTLRALASTGLTFDTSYNSGSDCGVADMSPGQLLTQPTTLLGIYEYPVTVLAGAGSRRHRNLQINACSYAEIVSCLDMAASSNWDSVVLVTHNFELLSPDKRRVDRIAANRFRGVCRYLDQHRDRFTVRGFRDLEPVTVDAQPVPFSTTRFREGWRVAQQVIRRIRYG